MEEFLVEVALLASITTAIALIICVADFFEKRDLKESGTASANQNT